MYFRSVNEAWIFFIFPLDIFNLVLFFLSNVSMLEEREGWLTFPFTFLLHYFCYVLCSFVLLFLFVQTLKFGIGIPYAHMSSWNSIQVNTCYCCVLRRMRKMAGSTQWAWRRWRSGDDDSREQVANSMAESKVEEFFICDNNVS